MTSKNSLKCLKYYECIIMCGEIAAGKHSYIEKDSYSPVIIIV